MLVLLVTNLWIILSSISHSIASFHSMKLQIRRGGTRAEKKLGNKTKMGKIYYNAIGAEMKKETN